MSAHSDLQRRCADNIAIRARWPGDSGYRTPRYLRSNQDQTAAMRLRFVRRTVLCERTGQYTSIAQARKFGARDRDTLRCVKRMYRAHGK